MQRTENQPSEAWLELKLEFLREQVRSGANIGIELIDLLDYEEAMKAIHQKAEQKLRIALSSYSGSCGSDPEIVLISLVLIAMLHYEDGNFYGSVRDTYVELYEAYSQQKIEGLIRSILSRYTPEREKGQRIIKVVLENAIVPSPYLGTFFEFIYDIYKRNFNCTLPEHLYEEFDFVYEGLRSSMHQEGDELRVKAVNKSYTLIQSLKDMIANRDLREPVIVLSIIVVRLIDRKFWNQEVSISNLYLQQGFEQWSRTWKDDGRQALRERAEKAIRPCGEPKFIFQNGRICLELPVHRMKEQYDYRKIRVMVENDGKTLYDKAPYDIREIIGGYQLINPPIPLERPLGHIRYRLTVGNELLYDSGNRLERPLIVFDQKGREIRNHTDYTGSALLCIPQEFPELTLLCKEEGYVLASKAVKAGMFLPLGDTVFYFSALSRPSICGEKMKNCYVKPSGGEKLIQVYQRVFFLYFECEAEARHITVCLDGVQNGLADFPFSQTGQEGRYQYTLKLKGLPEGVHRMEVSFLKEGRRRRVILEQFALDRNLVAKTERIDGKSWKIRVKSDLLKEPVCQEICGESFQEDWLKFFAGGKQYALLLPLSLDLYRISGGSWRSFREALWIGEIGPNSILELYGQDVEEMRVMSDQGAVLESGIRLDRKGISLKTNLGFLSSYKADCAYVVLLFLKEGAVSQTLFCYNKCVLDEKRTKQEYDPVCNRLNITPYYYGQGSLYMKITGPENEEWYRSGRLENGKTETVTDLVSFQPCQIIFYEKEKGLSLKKERPVKVYPSVFYARKDFPGRTFRVRYAYFDQDEDGRLKRQFCELWQTYLRIDEEVARDCFTGRLYEKTAKGEAWYKKINPVEIELCGGVITGEQEILMTNDGDGLFLDAKHYRIKDTLDDPKAADIVSYRISMNEEEKT